MLANIYTILKHKLRYPHYRTPEQNETQYIRVDWYLGQDQEDGEVLGTPVAYIEFLPTEFIQLPNGIQHGPISFNVILFTETVFGDERDMINETIGHQALETGIFKALQNQRTIIDVDAETQVVFHEDIVRKSLAPHTKMGKLVKSVQQFTCTAYDFAANPQMVKILLTLDIDAQLVKSLPVPSEEEDGR
jgi:hypothetical protein